MSDIAVFRVIDAALNRASEGLRVVEDHVRFVADDVFLTGQVKALRHELAAAARTLELDLPQYRNGTVATLGKCVSQV
jgi:thiamine-phosphate pyrophosphorylase